MSRWPDAQVFLFPPVCRIMPGPSVLPAKIRYLVMEKTSLFHGIHQQPELACPLFTRRRWLPPCPDNSCQGRTFFNSKIIAEYVWDIHIDRAWLRGRVCKSGRISVV